MSEITPWRWRPMVIRLTLCGVLGFFGCQTAPSGSNLETVADQIVKRTNNSLPCPSEPNQFVLPPGASFDDGVTEDEAVSIALWNNALFQEVLEDLNVARGDLIQAGLLPNPEFAYFFQVSDKPFKYVFELPIEAIWLRPIRVKSAAKETDRVADRLAQAGLDLMRDVRQAYADALLAKERVRIANEAVKLRGRIAELAEKRLKAGDISPQEEATARIDSLQAQQEATRIGYDVSIAEERLRNLMGIGPLQQPLALDSSLPPMGQEWDLESLVQEAAQNRPDALAAVEAIAAAEARLHFAKIGWVRLLGVADATSGKNGHELGPSFRFTVPLFNQNQGAIARAEAELQKASRNQKTVAHQIILDVRRAHLQYQQARAELDALRTKVRPEVEAAIRRAQGAYQEGNVTIFIVLETTRQLLDNYLREAQLVGDLRRAWADLERSVGHRLTPSIPDDPAPESDDEEKEDDTDERIDS